MTPVCNNQGQVKLTLSLEDNTLYALEICRDGDGGGREVAIANTKTKRDIYLFKMDLLIEKSDAERLNMGYSVVGWINAEDWEFWLGICEVV